MLSYTAASTFSRATALEVGAVTEENAPSYFSRSWYRRFLKSHGFKFGQP